MCYTSTYGIKGKGEGILLGTGARREFPRFRAFLLLFLILCFLISLSKSPRILAAKPGCALRKGNLTSSAAASKAAVILRAQSLYWHTALMIYTVQGIKCFKKLTLFRRPRSSYISVPSFVWGWDWLWGGQEEPDGSINETLGSVSQTDSSTRSMFSCQNILPCTERCS